MAEQVVRAKREYDELMEEKYVLDTIQPSVYRCWDGRIDSIEAELLSLPKQFK